MLKRKKQRLKRTKKGLGLLCSLAAISSDGQRAHRMERELTVSPARA
ncbi:MAG: hypothetical protein LBJ57_02025 [Prevotellaceae bacterium]|jgi:hypothetical protein|nr:hypothetical protein [Prevotellaceae bacterium]